MEPTYPLDTLALIFGDGPDSPTADVNSLYHASVNLSQDDALGLLDAAYLDGVRRILAGNAWREDGEWIARCRAWRAAYRTHQDELWGYPERW